MMASFFQPFSGSPFLFGDDPFALCWPLERIGASFCISSIFFVNESSHPPRFFVHPILDGQLL